MSIYVKHGTIKSMKSSHLLSLAYSYEQSTKWHEMHPNL